MTSDEKQITLNHLKTVLASGSVCLDWDENSLLNKAVRCNNTAFIPLLIEHGADIYKKISSTKNTILQTAAIYNSYDAAELLIAKG